MNKQDDKRLIEDYLPINAITREGTTSKGHINTLHLWWARRPLVACRAAVYGALVPASQFIPNGAQTDEKKKSLGRANAAKFVKGLCQYPGSPHFISEAQQHILKAHAERLTREIAEWRAGKAAEPAWIEEFKFSGERVSVDDITAERAPRPRLLDMFAGGGAIPFEALRLGCQAYALELNPVAHIIELCTLVYPQEYGLADENVPGKTGPKNAKGETTWGDFADEVRYWGELVLRKLRAEIGDLYPLVPDPEFKGKRPLIQSDWLRAHDEIPVGYLIPAAYFWTRTVQCKNPNCRAAVPLVRQTWICKKEGRAIALRIVAPKGEKQVSFKLIHAESEGGIGFDPKDLSKGSNATCPFCRTVADSEYVKEVGLRQGFGVQPMAVMAIDPGKQGKRYLPFREEFIPSESISRTIDTITKKTGITPPTEPLEANPRSFDVQRYGFTKWRMVFTERQVATHLSIAAVLRDTWPEIQKFLSVDPERAAAVYTATALAFSRLVTQHNSFAFIHPGRETIEGPWGDGKFPMSQDFLEGNLFSGAGASFISALGWATAVYEKIAATGSAASVVRGSALKLPHENESLDCVITDPPYYDSVSYSNLSDGYYVWLKRSLGHLYPEHFATELTPKKSEAIMAPYRHHDNKAEASKAYESMMAESLKEARRVLKPAGVLAIVYAHKTTLGWATLVDALRTAGFTIAEAWPLDTESRGGRKKVEKAMLASSIFLIGRKREEMPNVGNYEEQVRPELQQIVRERVDALWEMGISGADLVIACVGAGLRAFTRFAHVEYANGEEVPAARFLSEVETVVLDAILGKLSKMAGGNGSRQRSLAGLDPATRFYVLWRYTYGAANLDAGEAIIFANGTHVELDGPLGLSTGSRGLVEKEKGKYRLRDFVERGDDDDLGLVDEASSDASSTIDVLHRLLWLLEKRPRLIPEFISDAQPNLDQLRLVAQALAGPALKGGELENVSASAEQSALGKLLSNWNSLIEGKPAVRDRRAGQQQLPLS